MAHEILDSDGEVPADSGSEFIRVGELPRPRMLIIGFKDHPRIIERLTKLAPTVTVAEHPKDVNQGEFDLLVTDQFQSPWPVPNMPDHASKTVASHLSVVYRSDGAVRVAERVNQHVGVISGEFAYPADLPATLQRLVDQQLVPLARRAYAEGLTHRYFVYVPGIPTVGAMAARARGLVVDLHPFLTTEQGHVLAGWYRRSESSECWVLPSDLEDLVPWVDAAIEHLHHIDPDRFPVRPGWQTAPEWRSAEEQQLHDQLQALDEERKQVLSGLFDRENDLHRQLAEAIHAADRYERGLLTLQGDGLPEVVARALRELGFEVTEMDAAVEDKAQLLEDLQVRDPASPGWVALVEVRGYAGGAKTSDFQRIARFANRFESLKGQPPDARWYIVNHLLGRDPALRERIFAGQEDDTAAFAEDHGLAIETRQLFKLLEVARSKRVAAQEIREHLRYATGVFAMPSGWCPPQGPQAAGSA